MPYYRRSRFLRRVVLPLVLVAFLSACHHWVYLKPPIERALAEEQPESVRLTLVDDSILVVKTPTIEGDTLFGVDVQWLEVLTGASIDGKPITERVQPSVAVPMENVRNIDVRKFHAVGTVIGVLAPLALVLLIGTAAGLGQPDFEGFGASR